MKPLTPEQEARVAETRQQVWRRVPEAVPLIGELVSLGMMDGWRGVNGVSDYHPGAPLPPGAVSSADLVTETSATIKERIRNAHH